MFGDGDRREVVLKAGERILRHLDHPTGPSADLLQAYALLLVAQSFERIGDELRDLRHSINREKLR